MMRNQLMAIPIVVSLLLGGAGMAFGINATNVANSNVQNHPADQVTNVYNIYNNYTYVYYNQTYNNYNQTYLNQTHVNNTYINQTYYTQTPPDIGTYHCIEFNVTSVPKYVDFDHMTGKGFFNLTLSNKTIIDSILVLNDNDLGVQVFIVGNLSLHGEIGKPWILFYQSINTRRWSTTSPSYPLPCILPNGSSYVIRLFVAHDQLILANFTVIVGYTVYS